MKLARMSGTQIVQATNSKICEAGKEQGVEAGDDLSKTNVKAGSKVRRVQPQWLDPILHQSTWSIFVWSSCCYLNVKTTLNDAGILTSGLLLARLAWPRSAA